MFIKNLLAKMLFNMDGELALLRELFRTGMAAKLLNHLLPN